MEKVSKQELQEYRLLLRHSRLLRAATNLAYERSKQLENTMQRLGIPRVSQGDIDGVRLIQVQTIKELGKLFTKSSFDESTEIEKYHHGPTQVCFCLLYTILERHKSSSRRHQIFKDDEIDKYCKENKEFIESLKGLRNSILHPRHDQCGLQEKFFISIPPEKNYIELLLKGQDLIEKLLRNIECLAKSKAEKNNHDSK